MQTMGDTLKMLIKETSEVNASMHIVHSKSDRGQIGWSHENE